MFAVLLILSLLRSPEPLCDQRLIACLDDPSPSLRRDATEVMAIRQTGGLAVASALIGTDISPEQRSRLELIAQQRIGWDKPPSAILDRLHIERWKQRHWQESAQIMAIKMETNATDWAAFHAGAEN